MKILFYSFKCIIWSVLVLFLSYLGYRCWQSWCNPITVLIRSKTPPKLVSEVQYESKDDFSQRLYIDVSLDTGGASLARFTVSLPKTIPNDGLPCILVIAGLETGRQSLNYISDQSDFAIIAYEYPQMIRKIRKYNGVFQIKSIRQNVFNVPDQIVSITQWAKKQPWCSQKGISVAGYSFGAIFTPAIYHLAQIKHLSLGPGVIGYGGAGLYDLFYANLSIPQWMRSPMAQVANFLFRPIEPALHAPYLNNRFLIINGTYDNLVPFHSAEKLQLLIPKPKEIINLPTQHMYPENTALLNELLRITKKFLNKNI